MSTMGASCRQDLPRLRVLGRELQIIFSCPD